MRQNKNRGPSNQVANFDRQMDRMDVFGRHDPFQEMNQVMRNFGGFGGTSLLNDDFFKNDMMSLPFDNPMDRMMGFSDMHQKAHKNGREGSFVSQTFVSSSSMGPDGKVKKQSYYQNNVGQHQNGNTISQKQQAYKDSNDVRLIAQQRMLNDKGHKVIKQKRGQNIEQSNNYYNIQQQQASQFHNSWQNMNQQTRFLENHQKYNRGLGYQREQPKRLGYQPSSSNQNRLAHNQINTRNQPNDNYSTKSSHKGSTGTQGSRVSRKY